MAPTPSPPTWPREGSTVSYRVYVGESLHPGSSITFQTFSNVSWTYSDDDWRGTCSGERVAYDGDVETGREDISRPLTASDPPHWPLFNTVDPPDEGDDVEAWFMKGCGIMSLDREYAGMEGGRHVATDYDDGSPDDFRTEWMTESGLVTMWTWSQRHTNTQGVLTATNAPG